MVNKSTKLINVKPIELYLENEERNVSWLSKKAKIPYGTLYSVLVKKERGLSEKNRKKINAALKTNF